MAWIIWLAAFVILIGIEVLNNGAYDHLVCRRCNYRFFTGFTRSRL